MTNPQNVVVNSTTQQTGIDAGDYKTQIIFDTNFNSFDRVSSYAPNGYSSVKTGSALKRALDSVFTPNIKPALVKVGRSKGIAKYTPISLSTGAIFSFTLTVLDGNSLAGSYTVGAGEDAEDVCIGLKADFDADSDITDHVTLAVVGSGTEAYLSVTPVSGADDFTVTSFSGDYTLEGVTTEAASDTYTAVSEVDSDWSWVTSTNHEPTYQASMASLVETLEYKKYFTSSQLAENYASWDEISVPPANNVGATMSFNGYKRTNVMYHHNADGVFPEMARHTQFALLEPGRSNFQYKSIPNIPLAMIADSSRSLNASELANLAKVYMTTVVRDGGVSYIGGYNGLGNRMADGTRIESVYWIDRAAQVIKQRILTLQLNSNKLALNDSDIARIKGSVQSWLTTQVSVLGSTYALDPLRPFKITCPSASEISQTDKVNGLLKGFSVVAYSDASIDKVISDLTVTFYDPTLEG